MRALLLAAGLGTRLRPVTETVPKCLVPINGKPLLDYWTDLIFSQSGRAPVERALLNTHYLAGLVRKHIERSPWTDRIDLVHEETLLGTGGTIVANAEYFGAGDFMVAHADNLSYFDLSAFCHRHLNRPTGTHMTMMTFETDAPEACGIVELDDRGVVQGFHEKVLSPPGNLANGAVYIFDRTVLEHLLELNKPEIDLSTEVLPAFVGRIATFHNALYHRDIGTPQALDLGQREMAVFQANFDRNPMNDKCEKASHP